MLANYLGTAMDGAVGVFDVYDNVAYNQLASNCNMDLEQ